MTVSVIIVNFNTRELLDNCLNSVFEKTKEIEYEIIVVDNNSFDDSAQMVANKYPRVKLVCSPENLGFGRANNLGTTFASGEYLFFLNSDTVLLNNAIAILVSFLEQNRSCGMCGGNLTDFHGEPIHSFSRTIPSPFSDIYNFYKPLEGILYGKNWFYNFLTSPMEVGYITGADLLMRTSLFRELSGFDPTFFMYYEETDLEYRAKKKGNSVFSVPDARISHYKGASLHNLVQENSIFFRSKYYYLLKLYGELGLFTGYTIFSGYCLYKISGYILRRKKERARKYLHILRNSNRIFWSKSYKKDDRV